MPTNARRNGTDHAIAKALGAELTSHLAAEIADVALVARLDTGLWRVVAAGRDVSADRRAIGKPLVPEPEGSEEAMKPTFFSANLLRPVEGGSRVIPEQRESMRVAAGDRRHPAPRVGSGEADLDERARLIEDEIDEARASAARHLRDLPTRVRVRRAAIWEEKQLLEIHLPIGERLGDVARDGEPGALPADGDLLDVLRRGPVLQRAPTPRGRHAVGDVVVPEPLAKGMLFGRRFRHADIGSTGLTHGQ